MAYYRAPYSPAAILDWLHRTLGVNSQSNQFEVKTECPKCGGDVFYFNTKKQVGGCKKASCDWNRPIFLKDLIELVGFTPNQYGEWEHESESKSSLPESVPGVPILGLINHQMMCSNVEALQYLRSRGIEDGLTLNWKITCDGARIYVPIYSDQVLVNYNSRVLPRLDGEGVKKYLYHRGADTSRYLLGWNECRDWTELALVENTFVSLAYRNRLHCSTSFGSTLSAVQADLIAESKIRTVVLLWDENAWKGADKAYERLGERGIACAYWRILGQPDDYPFEWVAEKHKQVQQAARDGIRVLDFRAECAMMRENDDEEVG